MTEWLQVRCPSCGEWVTVRQTYERDTGAWNLDLATCECGHQIEEEDMAECDVEPGDPPEPPEPPEAPDADWEPPDWSSTY